MTDLEILSDCLGSQPYFTGDMPTEIDCGLFGVLGQVHP